MLLWQLNPHYTNTVQLVVAAGEDALGSMSCEQLHTSSCPWPASGCVAAAHFAPWFPASCCCSASLQVWCCVPRSRSSLVACRNCRLPPKQQDTSSRVCCAAAAVRLQVLLLSTGGLQLACKHVLSTVRLQFACKHSSCCVVCCAGLGQGLDISWAATRQLACVASGG